ncbi:GcrA cell cycle regulator [Mesorhizobium sp. AR10]|uniref:GcrA cell cycle regulator n=1 Tax=Mesorhizobium sp. AR10 TaxID=2865839 RepID=UPI002160C985|nr:GcrA cell cycle regulator [Mesorhizobium sp. AR10]UVK37817.1 GcrA cell cycle regulator [Mesorhizobium sp. AR10]
MTAYTDTELHEIAVWLRDGLSASKIATRFSTLRGSPVSRNAIIGIVHRNQALKTIGFANPKGGRSGGRPKKFAAGHAGKPARLAAPPGQAKLPGQVKAAGQSKLPAQAKLPGPAWLPPRLFLREAGLVPEGEAYRFKVPAPRPRVIGRQPHFAAMRFIDCLFGRCRAPLDLTLEEDPDNDAPGSRPGPDMLCCGLRTRALKSYCTYHQARFRRPVPEAA